MGIKITTSRKNDFETAGSVFLGSGLINTILMCVVCCKCCCGQTEKKYYHQMLAYGILMILSFGGAISQMWGSSLGGLKHLLFADLAFGLWMTILATVTLVMLPSEEGEVELEGPAMYPQPY